jgi:ferrous iron transport protein A
MQLSACPVGLQARVLEVEVTGDALLRVREVGLRPGATLRVLQRCMGGRVVAVGAERLAVDAATAALIRVEAR